MACGSYATLRLVSRHLVLVGLMGSGKTTVGRPLAARLGRPFVDNDDVLERRAGIAARDIEAAEGWGALHRAEADVLRDALRTAAPAVIAAAAAAVLEPGMPALLQPHDVVYLCAGADDLADRVTSAPADHRPFGGRDPRAVLREQFDARDSRYRALATIVVDASRSVDELVDSIVATCAG